MRFLHLLKMDQHVDNARTNHVTENLIFII